MTAPGIREFGGRQIAGGFGGINEINKQANSGLTAERLSK